jgi:uncharacterized protein YlxP (DUF503 family)
VPAIGVITFELRVEESQSLKDKRHVVKGFKDRLRSRFNVAVAEIDGQETWQRSTVAAVTVSGNHAHAESVLQNVERDAVAFLGRHLVDITIEWID